MRVRLSMLVTFLAACAQGGGSDTTPPETDTAPTGSAALVGPLWVLESLPGTPNVSGNGGRKPDLRFSADGNAGGFSGCNSMGGPYTVSRDSLRLGPLAMTMMACQNGMEVERAYAAALDRVVRFERHGTTLDLFGPTGLVARLTAQ